MALNVDGDTPPVIGQGNQSSGIQGAIGRPFNLLDAQRSSKGHIRQVRRVGLRPVELEIAADQVKVLEVEFQRITFARWAVAPKTAIDEGYFARQNRQLMRIRQPNHAYARVNGAELVG